MGYVFDLAEKKLVTCGNVRTYFEGDENCILSYTSSLTLSHTCLYINVGGHF